MYTMHSGSMLLARSCGEIIGEQEVQAALYATSSACIPLLSPALRQQPESPHHNTCKHQHHRIP